MSVMTHTTGIYRYSFSDNPWHKNDRREVRRDNPEKKAKFGVGAAGNYEREIAEAREKMPWVTPHPNVLRGTMTVEELCALGPYMKALHTHDAYHFMWATAPDLEDAFQVMAAWGFRYTTFAALWVKVYPLRSTEKEPRVVPNAFKGPGSYNFSCAEILLLGTRADNKGKKVWHNNTGLKGLIPAQEFLTVDPADFVGCEDQFEEISLDPSVHVLRVPHPTYTKAHVNNHGVIQDVERKKHSAKPEIFQDKFSNWLDPFLGEGFRKAEFFARRDRPGWDCYGGLLTLNDMAVELADTVNRFSRGNYDTPLTRLQRTRPAPADPTLSSFEDLFSV